MDQSNNAACFSLNMNNILFYIIFSGHDSFVSMLNCQMIGNVLEYYARFPDVVRALGALETLIRERKLPYRCVCMACDTCRPASLSPCFRRVNVVVFFFLVSIDTRMRHWILNTQQTQEDRLFQQSMLRKHARMIPNSAAYARHRNTDTPFLGQTASFTPLSPHAAVSIFLVISNESFFYNICNSYDAKHFEDTFQCLKELVMFA